MSYTGDNLEHFYNSLKKDQITKPLVHNLTTQLLRGTIELHKYGMCHNDIKLNNMCVQVAEGDKPKITQLTLIDYDRGHLKEEVESRDNHKTSNFVSNIVGMYFWKDYHETLNMIVGKFMTRAGCTHVSSNIEQLEALSIEVRDTIKNAGDPTKKESSKDVFQK